MEAELFSVSQNVVSGDNIKKITSFWYGITSARLGE
jgi:hypothetical protein